MVPIDHEQARMIAVDNNSSDLDVMTLQLKRLGFQVVRCPDPAEGIRQARLLKGYCSAIFTDYNLSTDVPDMNGEQLGMLIRFDNPDVRICIASADDFRPEQLDNFRAHKFYALRKPILRENLGKVIGYMKAFEFPPFAKYYP